MKYLYGSLLTLIVLAGILIFLLTVPEKQNLRGLAFPSATQEATTTGWADDGSVIRLDTAADTVGIGTTSPSKKIGVIGGGIFQETSGTTSLIISAATSGRGGCIEMEATDGTVIRIFATTTPPANSASSRGLVIEAGSCQ